MEFIITFKNKTFGGNINAIFAESDFLGGINPLERSLSNEEINQVLAPGQAWHVGNSLIIEISPSADAREPILFTPHIPILYWDIRFWFRELSGNPTGFLRDTFAPQPGHNGFRANYAFEETRPNITLNGNRAEIEIPNAVMTQVEDYFARAGVERPREGFVNMRLRLSKESDLESTTTVDTTIYDVLIKCTFDPPASLRPAARPESVVANYTTIPLGYETLYVPNLTASFRYNFYETDEISIESARRKSYNLAPVGKIPKYIELKWTAAPASIIPNDEVILYADEGGDTPRFDGIFGVPTDPEMERSSLFASHARSADLARLVADDTTTNLGLSEREDLILRERIRGINNPDAVVGPNEFSRYIGYVVLKERYNEEEEAFEAIDIIAILDRRKTRIIDSKIAYGDIYRYKVRTVYKFVNIDDLPLFQDPDTIIDTRDVVSVFDGGTQLRHAYYFDSRFSDPIEIAAIEETRPDPPSSIQVYPNSLKKEIFINWSQKSQQRDVVGYNVYRKSAISGSTFQKLNQDVIARRNNFFVDKNVKFGEEYIYALDSVDYHDNVSKLSVQVKTSLKDQCFDEERLENQTKMHLNKQVEFEEESAPKESELIEFKKNLIVITNPLFQNLSEDNVYLLKITSLDTFEEKEIKLNFKTKIINHIRQESVHSQTTTDEGFRRTAEDISTVPIPGSGRFGFSE